MTHELKIRPEYFEAVLDGTKTFELRQDDRGYAVGDVLRLREWAWCYTGREVLVQVTYILHDSHGLWLQPGVVALSIVRIDDPSEIDRMKGERMK